MLHLTLVEDDSIVGEGLLVNFPDALVCLHGLLGLAVDATTHVAEEANRSLVVELQCRLHLLALLATWYDECWVTTYLEEDFLVIGVLHVPDDVNLIAFQTIGNGKIEVIWIVLQGLLVVDEGKGETVGSLAYQLELCVTGEAMTREVIFGSVDAIGVVPHTANDREKDRRVAVPVFLVTIPKIFITIGILDALKFCSQ